MSNLQAISTLISLKVKQLIKERQLLLDQVNTLENENKRLQNEISSQKNTITALEERNKIVKLAESLRDSGGNDVRELKKVLNEYIRDIDECIRLLGER